MASYRSIRDLDWPMFILALSISCMGVLQIFSSTHDTKWSDAWWKQVIYICLSILLMWLATLVDYHTLLGQVPIMYSVSVALLLATYVFGTRVFGAGRWIGVGFLKLQVSEFVKLVIILLVARFLTEIKTDEMELPDFLKLLGLVGLPMLLVKIQPDFGTAMTYSAVLVMGIFLAGLRWQYVAVIAVVLALVMPLGYYFFLEDFQRGRLVSFLNPASDPKGKGYHVIQSQIAVGQGALWGRGVTRGSQTQNGFLPVPHADFIFSSFAEEHGFVGVVVMLGLYFLLLMQIVQNAQIAPDRAGMYVCMGVAALLIFHLLVNVGMVVGRMPVTGIPLPLMSAGGSNMISTFLMLGLVNNVRLRRFVN